MPTPDTEELSNIYKGVEDDSINRGLSPVTKTPLLPIRDMAFVFYLEDEPLTKDALPLLSQVYSTPLSSLAYCPRLLAPAFHNLTLIYLIPLKYTLL